MIKIYEEEISLDFPEFLKIYDEKKYFIFDIETTGFDRLHSSVMLIGFIYYNGTCFKLIQLFAESLEDEKDLLLQFISYIEDPIFITYNGYAFDIPYINKRLEYYDIDYSLNNNMNFDLYRVVRGGKKALQLENYRLKTIEEFLSIYREDEISGKENIKLYFEYMKTKNEDLKQKILLHNNEDIKYLIPIFKILDHIPTNISYKFMPNITYSSLLGRMIILDYSTSKNYIEIHIETDQRLKSIIHYDNGIELRVLEGIYAKLKTFDVKGYSFIDIDNIKVLNSKFNELAFDEKMTLLVNKENIIRIIEEIIKRYLD